LVVITVFADPNQGFGDLVPFEWKNLDPV